MKKITNLVMMSLVLLTFACNNDDDSEFEMSTRTFEQTTWKATCSVYDFSGEESISHYMLQFLTDKNGTYADLDEGREYPNMTFSYSVDKKVFTFKGLFTGDYTIMTANKDRIVLQAYLPEKYVIVMDKQY